MIVALTIDVFMIKIILHLRRMQLFLVFILLLELNRLLFHEQRIRLAEIRLFEFLIWIIAARSSVKVSVPLRFNGNSYFLQFFIPLERQPRCSSRSSFTHLLFLLLIPILNGVKLLWSLRLLLWLHRLYYTWSFVFFKCALSRSKCRLLVVLEHK